MKKLTSIHLLVLLVLSFIFVKCNNENSMNTNDGKATKMEQSSTVTISEEPYGMMPDGKLVEQYTLRNKSGMEIKVITYGGIITSWTAPDKNGKYENINLGFDSLEQYIQRNPYFGALIGRYGNRIAKGKFELEGVMYKLETNNGTNHLHGGVKGFDKVVWEAIPVAAEDAASLKLSYLSKDMESGYPGNLNTTVTYTLNNDNELAVTYEATSDKATIVNLTQHAYFNLSSDFSKNILDHVLTINADLYLPVDETLIPTGELKPVENTAFDFTEPKAVGAEIEANDAQLAIGGGYDHCWVLNEQGSFRTVASAYHPASGRYLEVISDEPSIQFYSGNFLDGTLPTPNGGVFTRRSGFCLETQHYPDSPNQANFPSVVLRPNERYTSKTTFRFSVR